MKVLTLAIFLAAAVCAVRAQSTCADDWSNAARSADILSNTSPEFWSLKEDFASFVDVALQLRVGDAEVNAWACTDAMRSHLVAVREKFDAKTAEVNRERAAKQRAKVEALIKAALQ